MGRTIERLVFLSPSNQYWGAEQSLREISSEISRAGIADVRVLTRSKELLSRLEGSGVLGRLIQSRSGRLATGIRFAVEALKMPARSTLIIFDLKIVPFIVLVSPLLRLQRKRIVLDVHDVPLPSQRLHRSIQLSWAFDSAVCVSEYAAAQIRRCRTFVVHRPVRGAAESVGNGDASNGAVFGVVGRVDPEKNVMLAAPLLRDVPDARLVVRGAPGARGTEYLSEVLAAGEEEMGARFVYEGRVSADQVMQGLDFLLFLNDREPSGRSIVEAQLAGVVVVGPAAGGASEFVEDGVTGITIDVDDLSAARRRVARLATDVPLREKMRHAAQSWARGAYDPQRQAALYADAVLGRGTHGAKDGD